MYICFLYIFYYSYSWLNHIHVFSLGDCAPSFKKLSKSEKQDLRSHGDLTVVFP